MPRYYQILDVHGRGPLGTIYRALEQGGTGRVVTLEFLGGDASDDAVEDLKARMARVAHLGHPLISPDLGVAVVEGRPALLGEYLPGCNLSQAVQRGAMPVGVACALARAVGVSLETGLQADPPLVHADLTPDQVLIGVEGQIKVRGFGVEPSTRVRPRDAARQLMFWPTPYSAPETLAGRDQPGSDVYALGAMLAEMVTGTVPSYASTQRAWHEAVVGAIAERVRVVTGDARIGELVGGCLSFDPVDRPGVDDVVGILATLGEEHSPPTLDTWATAVVPSVGERAHHPTALEAPDPTTEAGGHGDLPTDERLIGSFDGPPLSTAEVAYSEAPDPLPELTEERERITATPPELPPMDESLFEESDEALVEEPSVGGEPVSFQSDSLVIGAVADAPPEVVETVSSLDADELTWRAAPAWRKPAMGLGLVVLVGFLGSQFLSGGGSEVDPAPVQELATGEVDAEPEAPPAEPVAAPAEVAPMPEVEPEVVAAATPVSKPVAAKPAAKPVAAKPAAKPVAAKPAAKVVAPVLTPEPEPVEEAPVVPASTPGSAWSGRQSAPTVAPPTVSTVAALPPAVTGTLVVSGDAAKVSLVGGGGGSHGAGDVPAGSYKVMVVYSAGAPPTEVGSVSMSAGKTVKVTCKAAFMRCSVR